MKVSQMYLSTPLHLQISSSFFAPHISPLPHSVWQSLLLSFSTALTTHAGISSRSEQISRAMAIKAPRYPCRARNLHLSCQPTLADDTAAIRDCVLAELDQGKDVVVVAHSYGGCPANNALKDLDISSRTAVDASTSVRAIAFLCAMPQPAGTVLAKLMDPEKGIHDRHDEHFCRVKETSGPAHYFYNDISESEAKRWSDLLRPMSWDDLGGMTTYATYKDIPSSYLLCTRDNALPFPAQQGMVQMAMAAGAKVNTESVDAGHSPCLSKVEETSAFIRKVAGEPGL